jgi:hypothetical protein
MSVASAPDDGGPAFPSHGTMGEVVQEGMSLRDYFAAGIMQALIGQVRTGDTEAMVQKLPQVAYRFADAMLEARKR